MQTIEEVKWLLGRVLQLGPRAESLNAASPLLGAIPELDSMAVIAILTGLEDHYGFSVEDDEISADTFATLGTLTAYVESKQSP
jgi:acyl carrier protein